MLAKPEDQLTNFINLYYVLKLKYTIHLMFKFKVHNDGIYISIFECWGHYGAVGQ